MREKMGIMVYYNVKVRCVVAFGRYVQVRGSCCYAHVHVLYECMHVLVSGSPHPFMLTPVCNVIMFIKLIDHVQGV